MKRDRPHSRRNRRVPVTDEQPPRCRRGPWSWPSSSWRWSWPTSALHGPLDHLDHRIADRTGRVGSARPPRHPLAADHRRATSANGASSSLPRRCSRRRGWRGGHAPRNRCCACSSPCSAWPWSSTGSSSGWPATHRSRTSRACRPGTGASFPSGHIANAILLWGLADWSRADRGDPPPAATGASGSGAAIAPVRRGRRHDAAELPLAQRLRRRRCGRCHPAGAGPVAARWTQAARLGRRPLARTSIDSARDRRSPQLSEPAVRDAPDDLASGAPIESGRRRSDPPQHGDDAAEDERVVAGDRFVLRVVRHQPHVPVGCACTSSPSPRRRASRQRCRRWRRQAADAPRPSHGRRWRRRSSSHRRRGAGTACPRRRARAAAGTRPRPAPRPGSARRQRSGRRRGRRRVTARSTSRCSASRCGPGRGCRPCRR